MSKSKKNKRKNRKARQRTSKPKSSTEKKSSSTFLMILKRGWKVVVGIGVLLGIAVAAKTLLDSENNKTAVPHKPLVFKQPRFSEQIENIEFSFGEGGMTCSYKVSALQKRAVWPHNFSGFKPVKLYLKDGILYADVKIYAGSGMPPIQIIGNKLSGKPSTWDFNSNDKAVEIVNERRRPIYQFYYKTPSHIVVNGVFPFPNGFILARPQGGATIVRNMNALIKLDLKSIFKYPSWKYPGEYAD